MCAVRMLDTLELIISLVDTEDVRLDRVLAGYYKPILSINRISSTVELVKKLLLGLVWLWSN